MSDHQEATFSFHPARRRGLLFQSAGILLLGGTSGLAFLYGLSQNGGTFFVLFLILSLLLFAPLPLVVYRAYALATASYRLERDGLRMRWGLRAEDVPLPEVEWVRRVTDLASDLPLPWLHWPGAILGSVETPDLGRLEYLAADTRNMLLIATPRQVYAISPENPDAFLRAFQRAFEMGSLTPISSVSVLPAAYLTQVWSNPAMRILLIAGFALNLLLFIAAGLLIPGRTLVSLGYSSGGIPLPGVPAAQLLLLPILGAFTYIGDLATGLFFFRREGQRTIAYVVMGSAVISGLLLLIAILINLNPL